jgi:hypothetical protein
MKMRNLRTAAVLAALMITTPAMADDHACALTHSNAAEMTLRHFAGGHPEYIGRRRFVYP